MRDQLKLLEELQRHDARLQELESVMKSLPEKLRAAENALAELEKLLSKERDELLDTEAFRRSQEDDQRDAEQLLNRAKSKLSPGQEPARGQRRTARSRDDAPADGQPPRRRS